MEEEEKAKEEKRKLELEEACWSSTEGSQADLPPTRAETEGGSSSLHAGGRGRRGRRKNFLDLLVLDKVVDVPVIINDTFLQFVFQLRRRDRYPQCICSSSLCSSWTRFLTCPLWYYDRCLV